jgi:hypothetical protein
LFEVDDSERRMHFGNGGLKSGEILEIGLSLSVVALSKRTLSGIRVVCSVSVASGLRVGCRRKDA